MWKDTELLYWAYNYFQFPLSLIISSSHCGFLHSPLQVDKILDYIFHLCKVVL